MVHTLPDYSTKYRMTNVFGNIDHSELAARLGSPSTFDRRGNIIFMDSTQILPTYHRIFRANTKQGFDPKYPRVLCLYYLA